MIKRTISNPKAKPQTFKFQKKKKIAYNNTHKKAKVVKND